MREVQRAKILLKYADNIPLATISSQLNVSQPTIYTCIEKALATGVESGLKDKYHSPKEASITDEAKAWIINVACQKPKDFGYRPMRDLLLIPPLYLDTFSCGVIGI